GGGELHQFGAAVRAVRAGGHRGTAAAAAPAAGERRHRRHPDAPAASRRRAPARAPPGRGTRCAAAVRGGHQRGPHRLPDPRHRPGRPFGDADRRGAVMTLPLLTDQSAQDRLRSDGMAALGATGVVLANAWSTSAPTYDATALTLQNADAL